VYTNLLEYAHEAGGILGMGAVDGTDQIGVVGQRGDEESGTEKAGYLRDFQELLYVGYCKQAGFRVRLDIQQEQA
jgi:hypothetical protein